MLKPIEYLVLFIALVGCTKDETPIDPVPRGNVIAGSVSMGQGYPNQVYFNLNNQLITGQTDLIDWDLRFECGTDGWIVNLNDARLMHAWASDFENIEAANDSAGYGNGKRVETATLSINDPAMGDWREGNPVYLIDMGYSSLGEYQGLRWIQIIGHDVDEYSLKFKSFNDSQVYEMTAITSAEMSFVYYKLGGKAPVDIPTDSDWQIKFTKYTYQFEDPPLAYLVTGVILNPNGTAAAEFSVKPFAEISASDTMLVSFSDQPDVIGYDWKYYNFDLGSYEIDTDRSWIIRTAEGFYYKFRFTDFYDENGQVGTPQFELALI